MPPRTRASVDTKPVGLKEQLAREVKQHVVKTLLAGALALVLIVMWARVFFGRGEDEEPAAAARRAARTERAAAVPQGAALLAPLGTAAAPAGPAAVPAGAAPGALDPEAAALRLERLAARLAPRPARAAALPKGLRDPFDRTEVEAAAAAIAALSAARPAAASEPPPPAGRLTATVPEMGLAFLDGRGYVVGERAGAYELVEVGHGYAVLVGAQGTLRLTVWREQENVERYVRPKRPKEAPRGR